VKHEETTMSLQVVCPNPQCRKTLSVKDDLADRPLRCPACNTLLAASSTSSRPRNPSTINTSSSPRQSTMESPLAQQPIAEPSASTPKPVKSGGKEDLPAAIGPYQISRELGRGAFGVVYLGHDSKLNRDVAIKVLKKDILNTATATERFLREAQVVAQMHHNHIVPVYQLGKHDGCQYIASRFVPGKTVADLIPDDGMEPAEAVKLVLQLLEALAYAHEMNVLHRDVKPANAIVDARGHLSLMDFGLAGWLGQTQGRATQDGTVMGTPAYMPPEQARGDIQHLSAASDQYSASVVLYELLTGHLPFEGGPLYVLLHNVIETPPPPLSEYRPGLDRQLEAICLRALAKRSEERFRSCREFAEALRTWQAGRDPSTAVVGVPPIAEVLPEVIPLQVEAIPAEQEPAVRVPEPPRRRKARRPAKAESSFAMQGSRWWLWLLIPVGAVVGVLLLLLVRLWAAGAREGVLPVGADGRPLNLDFETGTLEDWTAEGDAFKDQPIKGDTVAPRRGDMKSQHQGQYWIGGYEKSGDRPQGTLTSVPFKVTHPWASFLVGGGPHPTTCVELVRNDTKQVFSRTSGIAEENLRRVVVDLQPHLGKEIFIRLVDKHSGHWGHINFDDFRFHATKPHVPPRRVSTIAPPDEDRYASPPSPRAIEVMTAPRT
jgi:tRNA A-37 threonylcarbamoyl transferase component Bud32